MKYGGKCALDQAPLLYLLRAARTSVVHSEMSCQAPLTWRSCVRLPPIAMRATKRPLSSVWTRNALPLLFTLSSNSWVASLPAPCAVMEGPLREGSRDAGALHKEGRPSQKGPRINKLLLYLTAAGG